MLWGLARFACLAAVTVAAGSAFVARFPLRSRAEGVLAAMVSTTAVALLAAFATGLGGTLRYEPLLAVSGVVGVLGFVGTGSWRVFRRASKPARGNFGGLELLGIASVFLSYGYVVFLGSITPPFAGDALMYHLPIVAEYATEGRIVVPRLGRLWNTDLWAYYPGNAYLLYQWWVLPFGEDTFVDLAQLPFAFGAALATYLLATRFGARRRGALWAALLFLAVPIVLNQAKTAMVDVTLSFFFLAGLYFLTAPRLDAFRLVLGALAWGMAPGVKLSALVYLALGTVAAGLVAWRRDFAGVFRRTLAVAAAVGSGVAVGSGYWLVRNWVLRGSPLYPANLVGSDAFAWTNVVFYGPLLPLLDFTVYAEQFLYNYETGVGVQFVALAVPSSLAVAYRSWKEGRPGRAFLSLLPILAYPYWIARSSRSLHTLFRYLLPVVPVGFATAGALVERSAPLRALALFSVLFGLWNALPHVGSFLRPELAREAILAFRAGEAPLGRFQGAGDLAVQDYRVAWAFFDRLPPSRLAASHVIFSHPFRGADLRHRIFYFEARDAAAWLREIEEHAIDYVLLGELVRPNGEMKMERGIARLLLEATNTGDEYVIARGKISRDDVRRLRVSYRLPEGANAEAFLGLDGFVVARRLRATEAWRTVDIESPEAVRTLDLLLESRPRTRIGDRLVLEVSDIWAVRENGTLEPIRIEPEAWAPGSWPPELGWMRRHPERFALALEVPHFWGGPNQGKLRVYRVLRQARNGDGKGGAEP